MGRNLSGRGAIDPRGLGPLGQGAHGRGRGRRGAATDLGATRGRDPDRVRAGLGTPRRAQTAFEIAFLLAIPEPAVAGDVGSGAYVESRFRAARYQVALEGQISDLIAHVNMLVNDPAVGPDARAARNLLRTLTVI